MIPNALIANTLHAVCGIGGYASDKLGCVLVEGNVQVLNIRTLLSSKQGTTQVQIDLGEMNSKDFHALQDKFQQTLVELLEMYPESPLKGTNFQLTHK